LAPGRLIEGSARMAHHFRIKQNKAGAYVAYFMYNSEPIFWTEGYKSRVSAQSAIASVQTKGPGAATIEE
jgi:uncharacterized protein YegP (UPF0339 family)